MKILDAFLNFFDRLRLRVDDSPEARAWRIATLAMAGMWALGLVGAGVAFLVTLQAPQQTQVPDVEGMDLADALLALQDRNLVPHVQLRSFPDPSLEGRVVSHRPSAGAAVRFGRSVSMVVSEGAVLAEVPDFRGRPLDDVRAEIRALGTDVAGVLSVDEISYVFDASAPDTVIGQSPSAGSDISGPTRVSLVVSRGPDIVRVSVPALVGLEWDAALERLMAEGLPPVFSVDTGSEGNAPGTVVAQNPAPGQSVDTDNHVQVQISQPELDVDGTVFGVLSRTLPRYATPVELTVTSIDPEENESILMRMNHPGGPFAVPYTLQEGSTLVLSRFDDELSRLIVGATADTTDG